MPKEQIAKKNKRTKGVFGKSDKHYGVPDTDKSDVYYGEVAKGKADEKAFNKHWS